jgi:CubicO group peptidase (beta-lactamase class C family)
MLLDARLLAIVAVLLSVIRAAGAQAPARQAPVVDSTRREIATSAESPARVGQPLTRDDLEAWLDGFMPFALKSGELAGAAVVVVKDAQILLKKGYGYADVATKRPMDPDTTLVRPGSISKLFTWIAAMQLVEQGKLDLDHDVHDYLDFRIDTPFHEPTTLHDLMTHRAGFEEGLKSILMDDPRLYISTEEYLKTHQPPVLFPPGEVPAYSNYGAALMGYIVQRVSGEPFETYVERHILAPLGMTRSTFRQPLPEWLAADMSKGYMTASQPPRPFELLITGPAGALSATPVDMAKFMIALLQEGRYGENRILTPETVRLMYTPSVPRVDDFATIAHGFFEERRNGRRVLGHGGDSVVFHSDSYLLVDDGVGVFYSVNSRGADDSNYATRSALFDEFLERYFPARSKSDDRAPAAFPAEHAHRIAGRYQSSRRVESSFTSVLYVLGQTLITANEDGTIEVPTFPTNESKPYREIAPFIWREVDGPHKVALLQKDGRKVVVSNDDPTAVLQPVPSWRSGGWNLWLLLGSIAALLCVVAHWAFASLIGRARGSALSGARPGLWVDTLPRFAALIAIAYLIGWGVILAPSLSKHWDVYNASLDPFIRSLQIAGLLVIAGAGMSVYSGWHVLKSTRPWNSKLWHLLLTFGLLGILWFSFVVRFIGFDLNY